MRTAQPSKPIDYQGIVTDHVAKPASDLTLEQLALIRDNSARAISDILNRFTEQTGLKVESVDLVIAVFYGSPQRYSATLDVRL